MALGVRGDLPPQRLLKIPQINRAGATNIDPKSFRIAPKSPRIAPKSPAINLTSHRIKDPKHPTCVASRAEETELIVRILQPRLQRL